MTFIFWVLCMGTEVFAEGPVVQLVDMDNLLDQKIEWRTRQFMQSGISGVRFLREIAFDKKASMRHRWRAITTMGSLDTQLFHKDIERALVSSEWFMRNAALIAIESGERAWALKWSLRLLHDKALVVRTQAVRNLVEMDATEAEPTLWRELWSTRNFFGHQSLWIRAHIAEALVRFQRPGRQGQFRKMLLDHDERLHVWAIRGLEATTGVKLSGLGESVDTVRRKWLSWLGADAV